MQDLATVWLLSWLICSGLSTRILVVLPFPGRSLHIYNRAIMQALLERGHDITEYSPYPPSAPHPNHTHMLTRLKFEKFMDDDISFEWVRGYAAMMYDNIFGFKITNIWAFTENICEYTFKEKSIQKLLTSDEKFDLVIVEPTFGQESLLIFGHVFSAPVIALETFVPFSLLHWLAGNSMSLASIPDLQATIMTHEKMSFIERALNVISTVRTLFWYHHSHLPRQDMIMRRHLPSGVHPPPIDQLLAKISLYLINSHPSAINYRQPYVPNMVPIGGINIDTDKQKLSSDIRQFMDGAEHGVIYFSFGTVIPTHKMDKNTLQIFVNVFKKLPQRVLWKIKNSTLAHLPDNVMAVKWSPQIAVLGHPKCLLFITHGGLFSHHETLYSGIPTIGIPFFADQHYNVRFSEHRGTGLMLHITQLSEPSLHTAITTVLNESKYKTNAEHLSRIYKDREMSPKDTAVFWVEYILKHGEALHLQPAAAQLSWPKLLLADVFTVIILVISVLGILFYNTVRVTLTFITKSMKSRPEKTENMKQK